MGIGGQGMQPPVGESVGLVRGSGDGAGRKPLAGLVRAKQIGDWPAGGDSAAAATTTATTTAAATAGQRPLFSLWMCFQRRRKIVKISACLVLH